MYYCICSNNKQTHQIKCDFVLFVVNDTLDEMLDESGDEEEQDAIVTQVLDEIGIDISGRVSLVSGQC